MRGSPRAVAIFLDVSHTRALATVLVTLEGGVGLSIAPFEIGTIRLGGVSLLWWYGLVAAPVVAVTVSAAAFAWGARAPDTPE